MDILLIVFGCLIAVLSVYLAIWLWSGGYLLLFWVGSLLFCLLGFAG